MANVEFSCFSDDVQVQAFAALYWEWDPASERFVHKVTELAKQFGLSQFDFNSMVVHQSAGFIEGYSCPSCGEPIAFGKRSELERVAKALKYGTLKPSICSSCIEKERLIKQQEAENERQRLREVIYRTYSSQVVVGIPEELSFKNAVFLLSLVRYAAEENMIGTIPLATLTESRPYPLTPNHRKLSFEYDLINSLLNSGVIKVHESSDPAAFIFNEERTAVDKLYIFRVSYKLPKLEGYAGSSDNQGAAEREYVLELETLLSDPDHSFWPDSWFSEVPQFWQDVALWECLEYLDQSMKEHHFDFSPGDKTTEVIRRLLRNYSVSQIYNITWRGTKDAAARLQRERIAVNHAANSVITYMETYGERALANGWDLARYRRLATLPQSYVSRILGNVVLRLGDDMFDMVPHDLFSDTEKVATTADDGTEVQAPADDAGNAEDAVPDEDQSV